MALPPELLTSLRQEEESLALSLSSPSPPDLVRHRRLADKLLLEATPSAIRKVREIMVTGSDSSSLAAAQTILAKSPATREQQNPLASLSLSAEALQILGSAISKLAEASSQRPEPPHPAPEPEVHIL